MPIWDVLYSRKSMLYCKVRSTLRNFNVAKLISHPIKWSIFSRLWIWYDSQCENIAQLELRKNFWQTLELEFSCLFEIRWRKKELYIVNMPCFDCGIFCKRDALQIILVVFCVWMVKNFSDLVFEGNFFTHISLVFSPYCTSFLPAYFMPKMWAFGAVLSKRCGMGLQTFEWDRLQVRQRYFWKKTYKVFILFTKMNLHMFYSGLLTKKYSITLDDF